jgi:hypothetical protein
MWQHIFLEGNALSSAAWGGLAHVPYSLWSPSLDGLVVATTAVAVVPNSFRFSRMDSLKVPTSTLYFFLAVLVLQIRKVIVCVLERGFMLWICL